MLNLKKLAFAPLFLICFAYLCYQINTFIASPDILFSLSLDSFIKPIIIAAILLLTSLFFIIFCTLAQDWLLVGIVSLVAGVLPTVFLPAPLSLYLALGAVLSLVITFWLLLNKLKTYLTFQPSVLLSPSIRNLATMLALVIAVLFFISTGQVLNQKGVKFFDPAIDAAQKLFNPLPESSNPEQTKSAIEEQINKLKSNPNLAAQLGIDPETLNNPAQINALINRLQNQAKSNQADSNISKQIVHNLIQPYLGFVAPVIALIVFFTLTSSVSLLSIVDPLLLWLTFSLLKSTGFIKFQTEMREVKKLVV